MIVVGDCYKAGGKNLHLRSKLRAISSYHFRLTWTSLIRTEFNFPESVGGISFENRFYRCSLKLAKLLAHSLNIILSPYATIVQQTVL